MAIIKINKVYQQEVSFYFARHYFSYTNEKKCLAKSKLTFCRYT